MNYTLADENNIRSFMSVLPEILIEDNSRSIIAYEDDGTVCGAVSVSRGDIYYDIDWIYVTPHKRLSGVGRGLITEVKKMVDAVGLFPVHALFDTSTGNGLYEFFLSISQEEMIVDVEYSHDRYMVSVSDFVEYPAFKKDYPVKYTPKYFFKLDEKERNLVMEKTVGNLTITSEQDFPVSCEKALCIAVFEYKTPVGFTMVQKDSETNLHLTYLYADNKMALYSLFKYAVAILKKKYMDRKIYFDPLTAESERLAENLFPNADVHKIYEAEF